MAGQAVTRREVQEALVESTVATLLILVFFTLLAMLDWLVHVCLRVIG